MPTDQITEAISAASSLVSDVIDGDGGEGLSSSNIVTASGGLILGGLRAKYPLDVEGPEEGHFVKFYPVDIRSPSLTPPKPTASGGGGGLFGNLIGGLSDLAAELAVQKVKGLVLDKINDVIPDELISAAGILSGLLDDTQEKANKRRSRLKTLGSITLYTPISLTEDLRPAWTSTEVGTLGAEFGDLVKNGGITTSILGDALASVEGATSVGVQSVVQERLGNVLGGVINNSSAGAQALKGRGRAVNPHLEAFFKGVDFRRFSFNFKLAPRSAKEAVEIQTIIEGFKYHSLPGYASLNTGPVIPFLREETTEHFFSNPSVWNIVYHNYDKAHRFKHCALTGISVNRGASGTNSTFFDGQPVEVDLSLNFMELSIITKQDVEKGY
jgi:hypothetical protein